MYTVYFVKSERKRENMTNQKETIDAMNGGIGVFIGAGNQVGFAKDAKMLKYILDTQEYQCV